MSKREIRSNITEIQAEGSTLTGYIARFNSLSADLGGFSEKITPGCFASSISSTAPIRALVNHNTDHCIGNTASGTLQLHEDDKGLSFSCELPDTQAARDLKVSVTRGDVTGASFGFVTKADSWSTDEKGGNIRTLNDVELFEISPGCTFPAYESPAVQLRTLFPDGAITIPETRGDSSATTDEKSSDTDCQCDCEQCKADACGICSDEDCNDPNCDCQDLRAIMLALEAAKEF